MVPLPIAISISQVSYAIACNARYDDSSDAYYFTVSSCVFSGFSVSSNGGAISISYSTSNLSIAKSLFYSCFVSTSSYYGGAIYFAGYNLVLNSTCGQYCTAYTGQFFSIAATVSSLAFEDSCYQCPDPSYTPYRYSIYFTTGIQIISGVNSSSNSVSNDGSAFTVVSSSNITMKFLDISNCSSSSQTRVFYVGDTTTGVISYSNFVRNYQSQNANGLFRRYGTASSQTFNVTNCVFVNNTGASLFFSDGYGELFITNCWIAHSGYSLFSGLIYTTGCNLSTHSTIRFYSDTLNTNGILCNLGTNEYESLTSAFSSNLIGSIIRQKSIYVMAMIFSIG